MYIPIRGHTVSFLNLAEVAGPFYSTKNLDPIDSCPKRRRLEIRLNWMDGWITPVPPAAPSLPPFLGDELSTSLSAAGAEAEAGGTSIQPDICNSLISGKKERKEREREREREAREKRGERKGKKGEENRSRCAVQCSAASRARARVACRRFFLLV